MTGIFISYSRKDSVIARKLIEEFKTIKLDVWVDWEDIPPAVDWLDQVLQGIEQADAFVFLVSPDSAISEVCKVEVEHARKNHKRIIPVVVRDENPKNLIPTIRELNWIFLREQDDFKEGLEKVTVAINLDIEWVQEHRRLQVRALDWDRKKDPSLLLRGSDLRRARKMIATAEKNDPKPSYLQKLFIDYSLRDERRRTTLLIAAAMAIVTMVILSITAVVQWRQATANEKVAQEQRSLAEKNAELANKNAKLAQDAQVIAEQSEIIARAQRSAARAQIYQSRTGGLFTSTLLAIDSWKLNQSSEAEDILRKNISLLPVPVAQMKQNDVITALEFSPDGTEFVTASADFTACLWRLKSGEKLFCVTSPGAVEDAVFSPDGTYIVTGDDTGKVLFVDSKTGKITDELDYSVPIWDLNISPNGKELTIARDDGRITFVKLKTREFDYELLTYGSLYVTAFSPSGEWMAAGSTAGTITLWNLNDGRIVTGITHRGEVYDLAFSPDSSKLISGGSDNIAYVIDTKSGKGIFKITNEDWVEAVTFSPDGSWFVTGSDDFRIRVWDTKTGKERLRMLQDGFLSDITISPNGQWIATTGYDHTVRVWNAASGAEMFQIPLADNGNSLAFSSDGKYLVSGDQAGNINIWDISVLPASKSYLQFVDTYAEKVVFSPTEDWLIASNLTDVWLLTNESLATQGRVVQESPILSLDSEMTNMEISPDSNWIGISMDNGEVILYSTATRKKRVLAQLVSDAKIVFSSDSQYLITADSEGVVQRWNVTDGSLVDKLFEANSQAMSLAIHEEVMALGLIDKVVILNATSGQLVSEMDSPGDHQLMAFSSDGSLLAANNSSGQIYIWKRQGNDFSPLQNFSSEEAFSMVFNPSGDQLLVGVPGNVYFLNPLTGVEVARIRHKDIVNSVSYSADGKTLATASLRAIQFWDVGKISKIQGDSLIDEACSRLTQNFDAAQWISFFNTEPYKKLCEDLP
jgi:WD40 repeat protein